jgi:hypothetical protein
MSSYQHLHHEDDHKKKTTTIQQQATVYKIYKT